MNGETPAPDEVVREAQIGEPVATMVPPTEDNKPDEVDSSSQFDTNKPLAESNYHQETPIAEKVDRSGLDSLRDSLLSDTETARQAQLVSEFRDLAKLQDVIEVGKNGYQNLKRDGEVEAGLASPVRGVTMGNHRVRSTTEYIERITAIKSSLEENRLSEDTYKEQYGKTRQADPYHPERYREYLESKRLEVLAGKAQLLGFGNAALEDHNPRVAVLAYHSAGIIEHSVIVSKLKEYAAAETDPVAKMDLANVLNEIFPQQETTT